MTTLEVHTPDRVQQLLRMAVGDQVLAVPITEVREILQVGRLTPIPRTPAFVRGVMNLRGAVVPVLDLGARLGQAPIQPGRRSCIVVVDGTSAQDDDYDDDDDGHDEQVADGTFVPNRRTVMGLMVDAVYDVFDTALGDTEAVPTLGTRVPAEFLSSVTRAHGKIIGVLSIDRLLAPPLLASLIAAHEAH